MGRAGFSMVEMLVTLAIALIMILFLIPPLLDYLTRAELEQTGRQTEILLRKARQKAITQQAPARVEPQGRSVVAYVDLANDGSQNGLDPTVGTVELSPKVEFVDTAYTAIFRANGAADSLGSFRFRNRDGSELKVKVTSLATGNVAIEKLY